jgi:hypothetical protein
MNEFEDEYSVDIKYECRYEIDDRGFIARIECRFKEFSPSLERMIPEEEITVRSYKGKREVPVVIPLPGVLGYVTLLVRDVFEYGNHPKRDADTSEYYFNRQKDDSLAPQYSQAIIGFKTKLYRFGDSKEENHEKIREFTRDVAALILHAPLYNVYSTFRLDPLHDDPEDLSFSKTKPARLVKYFL